MFKISVVMSTYNGEKFLQEQLDSIVNQSILPDELIVVDDSSQDNTLSILHNFKNKSSFYVKIIENKENIGSKTKYGFAKNFETALRNCNGNIIFLSDQDDVWFKDKLATHIKIYNYNPNIKFIANDAIRTYSDLSHENISQLDYGRLACNGAKVSIGCCFSFKKELLNFILPIPSDVCSHDVWINKYVTSLDMRYNLNIPLQYFRRSSTAWSSLNEFSDCVSKKQCYYTRIKRILSFLFNKQKNIKNLFEELELEKVFHNNLINNHQKLKKIGIPNINIGKSISESLQRIRLLSFRLKLAKKEISFKKFKIILSTFKHNKSYSISNAVKDFISYT